MLAATLTTAIVFFPVIFLYGVSQFLFTALALAVILSLFASYLVAMTVVPSVLRQTHQRPSRRSRAGDSNPAKGLGPRGSIIWFNRKFHQMLDRYEGCVESGIAAAAGDGAGHHGHFYFEPCVLYPLIGEAYFPRTDPGQFVINFKAPTGTRLELTDQLVQQVEQIVREVVPAKDLKIIVSNIGVTPGFSSIYTPNSGPHTAFVQVGLNDGHQV